MAGAPDIGQAARTALGDGFIPVNLMAIQESDATNTVAYLSVATTPILDLVNGDTDSALHINWVASNSDAIIFQVLLPPDFDDTEDLVLHIDCLIDAATPATIVDTTAVINADSYFNVGDTKVSDASAAINSETLVDRTITIAAADIPTSAKYLTIELTPDAHTTDVIEIYGMWFVYSRRPFTA